MSEPRSTLTFFVPGKPAPGGSKTAYAFKRKDGSLGANVVDAGKGNRGWKNQVAAYAHEAMAGRPIVSGPVEVEVLFSMPRLKSHYRANGEIKPDAPHLHTKKPDATKLWRAVEDGMSGIVWADDSQVVWQSVGKLYGDPIGVRVTVAVLAEEST